eukprot:jgi/Undpi1/3410/HiC_scaffold_15.g06783.m1
MPIDTAYIGFSPQPLREAFTPLRVAVLKNIIPRRCSTMLAVECNKTILAPHVDGRQIPKPGHSLTAPKILRTYVKESTISGQSACNAREMLRIMTPNKGDTWFIAGRRVQAHTLAANVQSHAPYLVEEAYYFRTVNGSNLREQGPRFIGAVAGRHARCFESFLQGLEDRIDQLNELPLNVGELLSPQKQARGQFAETYFDKFLNMVTQRSTDFLESQDLSRGPIGPSWPEPK